MPEGLVDVVLSYCHHTLFDRTLEGLLPYLQGKGVGVINASVLSMGLLTPQARHPRPGVFLVPSSDVCLDVRDHSTTLPDSPNV